MNSSDKIETLLLVKAQIENWSAYQPEWHFLLHGNKDISIAYQRIKQLIQAEIDSQINEELSEYVNQGLGLHNIQ